MPSTQASSLLKEFKLGNKTLKNRVVMAPMTRGRATPASVPTPLMAEYYSARASAGLIVSEATFINPLAHGWYQAPGIYTKEHIEGWKAVTSAVHAKGGVMYLQLWHMGRQSHSSYHDGKPPVSASNVPMKTPYHAKDGSKDETPETPRALTLAEVKSTIADYVQAARNAVEAGFDGVEVHGANGYLLDQFLQEVTNHRTDEYGGSVENRSRMAFEVVKQVGEAIGFDRVGVRFSPNGLFGDVGSPSYREQFNDIISKVGSLNIAYVHVMDGLGFGAHDYVKTGGQYTLKDVRKLVPATVAVVGNCGKSVADGENDVASGDADLVAYGRPYIGNPDLVEKIAAGTPFKDAPDFKYWYYPHLFKDEVAKGYTDLE